MSVTTLVLLRKPAFWLALACLATGTAQARDLTKPGTPAPCSAYSATDEAANTGTRTGQPRALPNAAPGVPEPASGYRAKPLVRARRFMVVAAHPLAAQAGCAVLQRGGSAVDAAVAAQMVLGLVEPQSSGLGGGAFLLHYDARRKTVTSYDGRETAPAAATEDYLRYANESDQSPPAPVNGAPEGPSSFNALRQSGRSVGTPGVLRMLELAHQDHGRLPWPQLLQPAIHLAAHGFAIGGRLADAIAGAQVLLHTDPEAAAYFLQPDGSPKPRGSLLRNPAYAATLQTLAHDGVDAFYSGSIAAGIAQKIHLTRGGQPAVPITPGLTSVDDLAHYRALRRTPVCTSYRAYWVCGMGAPSSGGITVAATLGMLENFDLPSLPPTALDALGGQPQAQAVHWVTEAERLAYADRNRYIADPDFVPLPGGSAAALLDKNYLRERAGLIAAERSMGTAQPGEFAQEPKMGSSSAEGKGTTQITVVDARGNVVSMTSSIESSMGSFRMTHGFLLNNELTDFSVLPRDAHGPIANRVQGGKRPRSSMAPTLVFHQKPDGSMGDFMLATGSPGGAAIIQYVSKTLVGALDWGLSAQQATALIDFGAANSPVTYVGGEHPNVHTTAPAGGLPGDADALVRGLRARGHQIDLRAQSSGIATIMRTRYRGRPVLEGSADPRREGAALGDGFPAP
ncbi:gamma-glutamyltransferase family protein [Extensimonas sp. H3M7-6]|uniref:gamma-glutamyltransferase family protein n=1 Tax=Extensimonas soli TaxID=3031322 RepID=UPI0023D9CE46|nr:gamma-glutamyltransferase family protein [Extensimonas sp. H3M7-6]MDF1482405.1 gamma-glutamyltransferase family protein [Extensimonas sp. H3M7-6]